MFTRTSWLVIVAVLVLASGCALMSPTDPYAGMARGLWPYSSGGSQPATFQPVEGPLTLDEAIRVALVNNPEAAAMAHDVEALESQCQVAGSQRWPSLHMAGGYNRYLDS